MRSKFTLVLLALNLALFGYLVVSERPWGKTRTIDDNRRRVLGPEAANLSQLQITAQVAPDSPPVTVTLARDPKGDTWDITSPVNWPANDFAVRRILGELQFLEHETSFPVSELARNEQTLADYGLEKPRLVLVATPAPSATPDAPAGADAQPFTLRIGDVTAVGDRLYVLSPDGARIHVVARSLAEALVPDLARLRSDQLLTIPVFETRALTLQAGSTRTRLRRDQARWIFEAPITARAAKTPVELALNSLASLRVARFLPAPPAPELTGLPASPRLRVTLEGNSRRETLLLGLPVSAPEPGSDTIELHASLEDRPTAFTVAVPLQLLKTLDAAQTALRDRRMLDLDPSLVTSVTIAAPEPAPQLRIQKLDSSPGEPASWRLSSALINTPASADADLVDKLLRRLQLLDAVRPDSSPFVSDAPSAAELENLGFNLPERLVTLQLAAPPSAPNAPASLPSTLVLQIAQPAVGASAAYARLANQPFVYHVAPEIIDALPIAPRHWRDRTIFDLPAETRITRLVIRSATDADAPPLLDHTPSEAPAPEAVTTLLNTLHELRAREIKSETYPEKTFVDGVEKPWAYRLEATLEPAADGPLVLTLAERTGAMVQQVGSPALGLVFTLEQPVLDALWTLLYPSTQP